MSITKPFTFVAGTKARANEVNADFDTLYSQVNTNISNIAQNANDIDTLDNTKANINGSSTQVFSVADAIANVHAVNKQTLKKSISPLLDFISGLSISKDSGSPDDTILITPGSCYDSTKSVVLELANSTSKQNDSQGASTTYYIYIIGNATGSSTDILISPNSTTPTLPSGYTLYRQIGNYTTDSDSKINNISYYGLNPNSNKSASGVLNIVAPDWDNKVDKLLDTDYIAETNGYLVGQGRAASFNWTLNIYINGVVREYIVYHGASGSNYTIPVIAPVGKGDTYKFTGRVATGNEYYFVPLKGGN